MIKLKTSYRIILFLLTAIFVEIICLNAYAKEKKKEEVYSFNDVKYISTYDGDTFFAYVPSLHPIFGKRLGIRILGIDTPEIRSTNKYEKKLGYTARNYTKKILSTGGKIKLSECVNGSFSRIVCKVKNDLTEDLGADLIRLDYAEIYKK